MFLSLGDMLLLFDLTTPFCVFGAMALYLLPTINAYSRKHHNAAPILLVNVLLGWTLLGWVIALVWSTTSVATGDAVVQATAAPPPAHS